MKKKIIYIVVIVTAKEGHASMVHEELTKLLAPTRAEAGNISYKMFHDREDHNTFVFFERWISEEAIAEHMKTPHIVAYTEATKDAVSEWTIRKLDKMDEGDCDCDCDSQS